MVMTRSTRPFLIILLLDLGASYQLSSVSRSPQRRAMIAKATKSEAEPLIVVEDPARTAGVIGLWAGLIGYAALGAPGHDAVHQALDSELLSKLVANPTDPTVPALFVAVFNFMGIWPAIFATLLWPGRDQKLPAAPFLVGSVAFGMFAAAPYVALRRSGGGGGAPAGPVSKFLESRVNAALLAAAGVSIGAITVAQTAADPAAAWQAYADLFSSQLFVHVTTLDFCSFCILAPSLIEEDLRRRDADPRLKYLAFLPLYGPLIYLNLRPPLAPGRREP